VLVKALSAACATHTDRPENQVATFFFDSRGTTEQKSKTGLLKALLFQLVPACPRILEKYMICARFSLNYNQLVDLSKTLIGIFAVQRDAPTYIFIDAIDECEDMEEVVRLLEDLAERADNEGSNLNICISSRHYPTISIRYCAEISVDVQNHGDIAQYVSRELDRYDLESSTKSSIKDSLTMKAEGVFLWARLVLRSIARSFDAGLSLELRSVLDYLEELPETLHELFEGILNDLSPRERVQALPLFQWALLAQRPLSANEWVHILAFVDEPELCSIQKWATSRYGIQNMGQLVRRLRSMTGGLLEVTFNHTYEKDSHSEQAPSGDPISFISQGSAVAGSMEPFDLNNAMVQFTHLSVYQYFLTGDGLKLLGQIAPPACFGAGHIHIAATCLRYPSLDEMSPLFLGGGRSIAAGSEYAPMSTAN
jgi:hypothetical protein